MDFEKEIAVLEKKIAELKKRSSTKGKAEIESLTAKVEAMHNEQYLHLSPWQRVQLSRHPERPYTLDYIEMLFTDFMEFSGDRRFRDDKAVVGGFARFRGKPVMVIGTQKGRDMKSNLYRNFGWPNPEGYRKAMRLMRLAEKAGVPIVTFIDTPGAYPGISSEERHVGEAIAVNLRDMFSLTVPVVSVIIGEGGSGGAIGLGVGNRVLIMENAYYSVITPEGCAAILWKDKKYAPFAAEALQLSADRLLALGVVDSVIPEPVGGAQRDPAAAAAAVGSAIGECLNSLRRISPEKLKEQRYQKFRKMGEFEERSVAEAVASAEKEASASKTPAGSAEGEKEVR